MKQIQCTEYARTRGAIVATTVVQVLQELFYVLLYVLFYLWSLLKRRYTHIVAQVTMNDQLWKLTRVKETDIGRFQVKWLSIWDGSSKRWAMRANRRWFWRPIVRSWVASIFINVQPAAASVSISNHRKLLYPETGPHTLPTLFLLLVLRLFHFTTDRHQTSHTDWWQYSPQSHCDRFSSCHNLKKEKIDAWRRQFHACADTPLETDWPLHLHVECGHRRNQLCQISWKSVKGFRSCQTPKNGISHWNRLSPLQQCRHTHTVPHCDN